MASGPSVPPGPRGAQQPGLPSSRGWPLQPDRRGFSLIRTSVRPVEHNERHEGTQRNFENLQNVISVPRASVCKYTDTHTHITHPTLEPRAPPTPRPPGLPLDGGASVGGPVQTPVGPAANSPKPLSSVYTRHSAETSDSRWKKNKL